jgi:endo-1,3(4)-beta-glucanase
MSAAAVIGYLDPAWLVENKDFVNPLDQDVSDPSSQDHYFPVFRSFDWYCGHSWAKGLFKPEDGKDESSSSEDTMFAYGSQNMGRTINHAIMKARGNLILSVMSRSPRNYFLMDSDNLDQPPSFIGVKVPGITF